MNLLKFFAPVVIPVIAAVALAQAPAQAANAPGSGTSPNSMTAPAPGAAATTTKPAAKHGRMHRWMRAHAPRRHGWHQGRSHRLAMRRWAARHPMMNHHAWAHHRMWHPMRGKGKMTKPTMTPSTKP